jgi:transcriptional regulator with XRE-family HTH domain
MKSPTRRKDPGEAERPVWAKKLIELRQRQGLSQAALAVEAGLSQSAIADYERGRSTPNIRMMNRLASALKVSVTEFVDTDHLHQRKVLSDDDALVGNRIQEPVNVSYTDSTEYDPYFMTMHRKIAEIAKESKIAAWNRSSMIVFLTRQAWAKVMTEDQTKSIDDRVAKALIDIQRFYDILKAAPFMGPDPTD